MDQPRCRPPAPEGHLEGTDHQLRPQVTLHRPPDEPPGVNIEDERQVQEALLSVDVGDIRRPEFVWCCGGELPADQVLGGNGVLVAAGSTLPTAPDRSEEHTSELQSQSNLVCRLLLEKKNKSLSIPSAAVSAELGCARATPTA